MENKSRIKYAIVITAVAIVIVTAILFAGTEPAAEEAETVVEVEAE